VHVNKFPSECSRRTPSACRANGPSHRAGRGIGFALATALAQAGARVVINGRSRPALDAAATELRKHGGQVDIAAFDVNGRGAGQRRHRSDRSERRRHSTFS